MNRILILYLVIAFLLASTVFVQAQPAASPSLHGVVTDPSGAFIPGAIVQVLGPGGEQRTKTDSLGRYSFAILRPGKYTVRMIAKGFSVDQKTEVDIAGATEVNSQLVIQAESQVVNVEDEANSVSTDPTANGTALVLHEKELAALSDDPDELQQELQAMAGPGAGPNGGQIYIDGFTGGNMPPKSSIREVRINSNPFSAEYDRPGFGRIEILTKPGTDKLHGQFFGQFNKEIFNSRSPLLTQSDRPPYQQRFFGISLTGPIKQNKASYSFNMERRTIDENAFIIATTLDSSFNPVSVNQAIVTPRTRTSISPRIDYTINSSNTLVARYQYSSNSAEKQGIGGFNLATRAYNSDGSEHSVQLTETAILSPKAVNETRFQFMRTKQTNTGDNTVPAITVQDAFTGGGAQIGNSGNTQNRWELTNMTTYTRGTQVLRWGGRLRQSFYNDTSVNNFGGSYIFLGGTGPQLDANNQPIPGSQADLTALERYRRTLLFEQMGFSGPAIRALGGGASQFNLSAGTPTTSVSQFDVGLFINDDWRMRPNLTLSYGLRYETQTNIHDYGDWAPRVGVAWGIGGTASKPAKTVVRAGGGIFYDRIADSVDLQTERFNGITQQSFFLLNPDTFPIIPSVASLTSRQQPQQLQILYSKIRAPRNYQLSAGVDRQVNKYFRFSTQYVENRGVHQQRLRNINAPIAGVFPFGDLQLRELTESTGFSRIHQLIFSPSVNYKKMFLFGFYGLSYGRDDNGIPADPYNLRAEYGPSSFGDVRHRAVIGTNLPLPWNINISPFLMASSGSPYNITTGRDTNNDGSASERPALLTGVSAADCSTGSLKFEPAFGCFNLSPAAGTPTIGRNFARGPGSVMLNLRMSKTWSFGNRAEANAGGFGPGGMMKGGGPPPGGGGGGPMIIIGGPGGAGAAKKYNLTVSVNAQNVLNHPNFSNPNGNLSSPFFGQSLSLSAGGFGGPFGGGTTTTYNRKVDLQMRFAF
jgi:hypothetical protein